MTERSGGMDVALNPPVGREYVTQPGDSVMGIALRELGDEGRWREIIDANKFGFMDLMRPCDYYPVGTVLVLPNASLSRGPPKAGPSA